MNILNQSIIVAGHVERNVDQLERLAAIEPEQTDRLHPLLRGGKESINDIGRSATRANRDQEITGFSERFNLSREHLSEALVVGDSRQHRGVIGKCDGTKWVVRRDVGGLPQVAGEMAGGRG